MNCRIAQNIDIVSNFVDLQKLGGLGHSTFFLGIHIPCTSSVTEGVRHGVSSKKIKNGEG